MDLARKHYSRSDVKKEIYEYSTGRWIAAESKPAGDRRIFFRYWRSGEPIVFRRMEDVERLFREYGWGRIRTIYATANVYRSISATEKFEDPSNIAYTSPIWDIDGSIEHWREILVVARAIVDFLDRNGISKSVYLLWSGEGVHVHIHEKAFSPEVLGRYNPLDIAYSIVEYTIKSLKDELKKLSKDFKSEVKVENVMDIKRVFTVPLSIHRRLDLCTICFKPDELDSFDISWANPEKFRHNTNWRLYVEGEGDELAIKALSEVKGYPGWTRADKIRSAIKLKEEKRGKAGERKEEGKIGRYYVMALLQAARYFTLTGDLDKAKSFGLNRAIFYAWAKHYGKGYTPKTVIRRRAPSGRVEAKEGKYKFTVACGEQVPVSDRGWFIMGGKEQMPDEYDRVIAGKIDKVVPYNKAWKAALEYVKSFPATILSDPQRFYEEVYKPVRDTFYRDVIQRRKKPKKVRTLEDFFS